MNKNIIVGILLCVGMLFALYLYCGGVVNSAKRLEISDISLQDCNDYFVMRITLSLPLETQTLYNCRVEVKYLTQNGAWKTVSKNIGIVNYEDSIQESLTLDSDFKSGNPYLKPDGYYHGDVEPNINTEAYGYLKP